MKRIYKKNNYNLVILSNRPGFTIVELLVVIVVIGILAAITMVSYSGITTKANLATLQSDLSNNSNILKMYNALYGSYPTTLDASNCPTAPNVDTNYCLKASSITTLTYQPSSTTTPATDFSLYATITATPTVNFRTSSDNGLTTQPLTKLCPYGFIVVPGSDTYGTSDFCVMKYEAKIKGSDNGNQTYNAAFIPESRASGTPWVNISQTNAIAEAPTTCTGCHLITEAEWMTIAQNALNNPINWSGGAVGTGFIYSGHNDGVPANAIAASTDNDGYYGTGQTTGIQKRTLTLSNGEVIWDMSGNVFDWTAGQTTGGQPGLTGESAYAWKQWNVITATGSLSVNATPAFGIPAASAWTSTHGIGQLYSNTSELGLRGFLRGCNWGYGGFAGVLALYFGTSPNGTSTGIGFRVASS